MDRTQPKPMPVSAPRDPAELDAARAKIRLTCCYCHDVAGRDAFAYCAGCLAPHHPACFEEHGGCTVPGCGVSEVVRPQGGVAAPRTEPPRPGWRRAVAGLALGALSCVGLALLLFAGTVVRSGGSGSSGGSQVRVAPTVAAAAQEAPRRARLTLVGDHVELARVARQISAAAGRSIALDLRHPLRVTVDLRVVPWTEALAVVVDVAGLVLAVAPDGGLVLSRSRLVSFEAGVDLRDAFRQLALHAGRNLAIGASVDGTVQEPIEGVRWERALVTLAREHGLEVYARGDILHVGEAALPGSHAYRLETPRTRLEALQEVNRPTAITLDAELTVEEALERLQACAPYALVLEAPSVVTTVGNGAMGFSFQDADEDPLLDFGDEEQVDFASANGEAAPRYALSFKGATWEQALAQVCRVAGLTQDRCGQQIFLRPLESNVLRARHVELRTWLQLLADAAGAALTLGEGVQGVAAIDLDCVSYRGALRASAEAHGLRVEDLASGGYRVTRPAENAVPPGPERSLRGTALAGVEYRASAVVLGESARLAVINGRVYGEGEVLVESEGGARAWVGEIRDDLVLIEAVDAAGEETYSCLVLDY